MTAPADRALAVASHHLSTGRPDRVLEALAALPGDTALTPDALRLRAHALLALGRGTEAEQAATRGLADDPDDVGLLWVLGLVRARAGDLGGAEQALLSALRHRPHDASIMAAYARLLGQAGQDDKARRVLDRAAALEPTSVDVASARTVLAVLRGDDRAAQQLAREAVGQDPDSATAQALLGHTSLVRGDGSTGLRASRRAARERVGDPELAEQAREARLLAHPLMAFHRLFLRVGVVPVWVAGLVLVALARSVLPTGPATVVVLAWLVLLLSTWLVPPLLRRWARWRW